MWGAAFFLYFLFLKRDREEREGVGDLKLATEHSCLFDLAGVRAVYSVLYGQSFAQLKTNFIFLFYKIKY